MRRKPWVSIADDFCGDSEPPEDVAKVQLSHACACNRIGAGEEDRRSGASKIYDREDCVVSVAFGDPCYQIHCYLLEWASVAGDADTVEGYFWTMCVYLVLLAGSAPFNVGCNPGVHTWPCVSGPDTSDRLVTSGVTRSWVIVGPSHEVPFCQAIVKDTRCCCRIFSGGDHCNVLVVFFPL